MSKTDDRLIDLAQQAYTAIQELVDAVNVDYDRLEELRDMRRPWAIGWNMPGYMPDTEPLTFETHDDAKNALIDELERAIDETFEIDEESKFQLMRYSEALDHVKSIAKDAEFGETAGAYHWWLSRAHNDGLDEDDAEELKQLESEANNCKDRDDAVDCIRDDALAIEVRDGWHDPGEKATDKEYRICITTGGPAVQITGYLSEHGEPESAQLEVQDWFTRWTAYPEADEDTLLTYASCFIYTA